MKTLHQLSSDLGIGYWRIKYAHNSGKIVEPEVVGGMRLYSNEMCKLVKDYFESESNIQKKSPKKKK